MITLSDDKTFLINKILCLSEKKAYEDKILLTAESH